jgi:hypothetical protein
MGEEEFNHLAQKVAQNENSSYQLSKGVYIEIPPPTWGHGDFLVYLPSRDLMVRRNYVDYWYIDIGIFKSVQNELYAWTDLWLDVITPEPPTRYEVLDAEELAAALRQNEVSVENAALALESLHRLLGLLHQNEQSLRDLLPEVEIAEKFYDQYCREKSRV